MITLETALEYIKNQPLTKKEHDSWAELMRKDRDFRYATYIVLDAIWNGELKEKEQ